MLFAVRQENTRLWARRPFRGAAARKLHEATGPLPPQGVFL